MIWLLPEGCSPVHDGSCWACGPLQKRTCSLHQWCLSLATEGPKPETVSTDFVLGCRWCFGCSSCESLSSPIIHQEPAVVRLHVHQLWCSPPSTPASLLRAISGAGGWTQVLGSGYRGKSRPGLHLSSESYSHGCGWAFVVGSTSVLHVWLHFQKLCKFRGRMEKKMEWKERKSK